MVRNAYMPSSIETKTPVDVPPAALNSAVTFFNETSAQLSQSYHLLENRLSVLTKELDEVSAEKEQEHKRNAELATRMQALLDFLPGGVIVLDSKGIIVEANPAADSLLETPLQGRLWRKVIGECFAPRNDDGLEVSTRSGRRISIATSSLMSTADSAAQSSVDGQIILLTDQTETRRLQQCVSRSERLSAMGKMVSALAHQIRTPLSTAILYAGHLCESKLEPATRSQFSQKLLSRLQHMERQVRDMMLFVKSELPLNELVSVQELEDSLKEAAEVPLNSQDGEAHWQNDCEELTLRCHRDALVSALMNLVNNALQASGEPYTLILRFRRETNSRGEQLLTIAVIDRGPGIEASQLAKVTDLFMTTKAQGTGLGLAVVQSVARAHGGYFEILSEPGRGTLARICIPIHSDKIEIAQPTSDQSGEHYE